MPTETEIKEIFDRLNSLEKAFVRMEEVPQKLDAIMVELKTGVEKQAEKTEQRDVKISLLAETLKDFDRAERSCKERTDTSIGDLQRSLEKGNERFADLDKKHRELAADVAANYMRKDAPEKLIGTVAKYAAAILAIGGALAFFGFKLDASTRATVQAANRGEPAALEMIQTNGRTYLIRGARP